MEFANENAIGIEKSMQLFNTNELNFNVVFLIMNVKTPLVPIPAMKSEMQSISKGN